MTSGQAGSPGHVTITTFYGRLSANPWLKQFQQLRAYNRHYAERIGLSLSADELERQLAPPVPVETLMFAGRRDSYVIEKYGTSDGSLLAIEVSACGKRNRRWLVPNDPCFFSANLKKSILRALTFLGYEGHVVDYISQRRGRMTLESAGVN